MITRVNRSTAVVSKHLPKRANDDTLAVEMTATLLRMFVAMLTMVAATTVAHDFDGNYLSML